MGKLYLIWEIGPMGFSTVKTELVPTDVKPENLPAITKGEGQALLFELIDYDCSTNFGQAIESGKLLEDLKKGYLSIQYHRK